MTPAQQAEAAGIDLSLVEESLRLSPEQRFLQHQRALDMVLAIDRAGREMRERTQEPAAASRRR